MNKKVAIGISIVVGGAMMATAALAGGSGLNGYEVYKAAFKNTRALASMTGTAAITVADNGNVILKSNGTVKMDRNTKNMSGSFDVAAGDQYKTKDMYRQDGQTIIKYSDSEVYNVLSVQPGSFHHSGKWGRENENPARAEKLEKIVDLLVVNYQNYISLDNKADGTRQVSLQMSGSQISPVANAIASLVAGERMHNTEKRKHSGLMSGDQMPKLVDDIRIANIDIKADIDKQNFIKEQMANITITGKDAEGKNHEVVISVGLNLSGLNNTTPDSVDLTGKQVKTIQPEDIKRFGHHR